MGKKAGSHHARMMSLYFHNGWESKSEVMAVGHSRNVTFIRQMCRMDFTLTKTCNVFTVTSSPHRVSENLLNNKSRNWDAVLLVA